MPRSRIWQLDTVGALASAVALVGFEALTSTSGASMLAAVLCATTAVGAVAARRHRPLAAAAAFAASLLVVVAVNEAAVLGGAGIILIWIPFDLAYGLGVDVGVAAGLAGVLLLTIALQAASSTFNPFFAMLTLGPWVGGQVLRSRRRIVARLDDRNLELVAEQVRYVQERVRLERARIAVDLHDIVAHQMTLIVIQAAAAQRGNGAPDVTSNALDCILDAATEAREEVGKITGPTARQTLTLGQIDDLVHRAQASGLTVHYRPIDPSFTAPPVPGETAYRIVQEGLTNAAKHAPGAAVDIELRRTDDDLLVEVTTTATTQTRSDLADAGGGLGLPGLGDRVRSVGGSFVAGPTDSGGWRLTARLPDA